MNPRELITRRAAQEFKDGEIINLGFGMPTLAGNYVPADVNIILHTENGAFGFGEKPKPENAIADLANAGSEPITLKPGAAIMDLATSLGAMRNGYIDTTVLGALEVDQCGNIANWAVKREGRWWPGIGGAMDLTYGTKNIIATLMHTDKQGNSKIKQECKLPLTGQECVKTIITEKALFNVGEDKLILKEHAPGVTLKEIKENTEAQFIVADDFKEMNI